MSDTCARTQRSAPDGARRRDAGMTLPEVLVAMSILGLLTAVLSASLLVILRQQDNTEGRLNVAAAEQSVGLWVPADLSSAETVDTSPEVTPCGAQVCDGIDLTTGSNVLMLTWTTETPDGEVTTNVSYHFAPSADGLSYELSRVECRSTASGWDCDRIIVLRDLPGPPGGEPFVPGVLHGEACNDPVTPVPCTRPNWVIIVSEPLAPDAISNTELASDADRKNANRVIVSINGGGDASGAGGGVNQISITAGGTVRSTISANSVQGAPTFTEARSRCGGPMTLVVDESNSIGSAITQVKDGVRRFVEALAGTPVKLQIVRFHTYANALGSTDWHRYYDMTVQSDVDALLAAINDLRGSWSSSPNGGTNWEEALFHTFYNADASIAPVIPETIVFFTDGVPTFDRLVHKQTPGVLPADPPPPGAPWPSSTGSSYSQVAFRRADYIANQFRRSVRFVGVGVGAGITQSSNWIVDPGAGYRYQWERGSYRYVQDTVTYQARYWVRPYGQSWQWGNKSTYDSLPNSRRDDEGWTTITQSIYNSINSNSGESDGVRTVTVSSPISTNVYNANPTNPSYRAVTKTWNNGPDWELWTGSRPGDSSHYRSTKVYNSPPYEGYDPAITASTRNDTILARLIAGNDHGTPAILEGGVYTNAEIADMFTLPDWNQFGDAMEQIALGECGGTLTVQTKLGSGSAPDPFRYQNSGVKDSAGDPLDVEPTVVTTNQQFVTGTFDFAVPNGQYVTVDILPQNYSELTGYTPGAWTCRAGNANRPVELIDIPDAGAWKGVRVRVAANEAVSCQLAVSR